MTHDSDFTSCAGCGRRWSAQRECHCTGCHEHFGSVSAFDRHQTMQLEGEGRVTCHPPGELLPSGKPRCVWHPTRNLWVTELRDTASVGRARRPKPRNPSGAWSGKGAAL